VMFCSVCQQHERGGSVRGEDRQQKRKRHKFYTTQTALDAHIRATHSQFGAHGTVLSTDSIYTHTHT
jgi:hypothetical protein